MSYDEVEIEDMKWNETLEAYTYPCPCGDLFQITLVSSILGEASAMIDDCCRNGALEGKRQLASRQTC